MVEDERRMELDLPAKPESVRRARHELVRFAKRCGADLDNVAIAISVAVSNAVIHGRHQPGRVRIAAELVEDDLSVTVADTGEGFRPTPNSGLGMGLALIGALTTRFELETSGPGLTVSMRFPCPGAA
jgi:anti-sigma regulatory factor (Ser/Thr protein kinase)